MSTIDSHEVAAGPPPLTVRGVPSDPNLRVLALATLVNTVGNGALTTTFALYFTHVVGLRATQVGLALSVAALVGLLVQVPMGHLGDVRGPRELLRVLMAGAGVASLGLLLTDDIWLLVVVLGVQAVFDRGAGAVRNGLIARLAEGGQGVRFKAYLRAVTNVGISLGALLGGLALWVDRPWAYLGVFVLNAATFALAALVVGRLPHVAPAPPRQEGQPRLQVLRDLPFVVVTVLTGIFAIHFLVMELAVPLWLATRTSRAEVARGGRAADQHGGGGALPGPPHARQRLGAAGRADAAGRRGVGRRRLRPRSRSPATSPSGWRSCWSAAAPRCTSSARWSAAAASGACRWAWRHGSGRASTRASRG